MANYDFFDLTGLPFDPPEKSAKKIKAAIDKKVKELGASLGSETQQVRRNELTEKIKLLNDTGAAILAPDGKKVVENTYTALAEGRTQSEIAKLKATANLMVLTGTKVITDAAIKELRKERKLSDEHVREIFAGLGFVVKNYEGIDISELFPKQIRIIDEFVSALGKMKDPNPCGADISLVKDVYSFVAYLMEEPENANIYRQNGDTSSLQNICDTYSRKNAAVGDEPIKSSVALATLVKVNIFDNAEDRRKYEFYLKYKTPELNSLFNSMRGAPKQVLLESNFAEPCIKQIANMLDCSYEIALAVYNKEGNVSYAPKASVYLVKCQFCGTMNQYPSEQDAIKANACSNCKKSLFKKCTKCGRMVLASLDKCPYTDCGFVFASAVMFSKYFASAEEALRKSDFDLARKYLFEAQSADPSEKCRIEQLSSTINSEEIRHKEPINKLKALTSAKKFVKAQAELPQIIQKYPHLNIADIEKSIKEAITKADAAFESAQWFTASKRADVCISILQYCADHQPSLNFLRATQPASIKNLSATANNAKGCINLAWSITEEQGIKYHLVRKNGKNPPVSISDGTILLEETNASSYCDKTVTPGNTYSYSLFVSRMGVFSDAVTKVAVLYSDVQELRAVQNRDSIRLTWDMPQNNMGATVTRTALGKEVVLSRSACGSLEDSNIQYGVAYTYKVSVNYSDSMSSPGVKVVVTPFVIIDSFRVKATHVKDNVYKVSWDIKQPNVDLRIMVNKSLVSECTSDENAVQIFLPKEGFSIISVMAYSGGKWVESDNSVQANTYSSCSIDKKRTELVEENIVTPKGTVYSVDLKIRLAKGIPNNVAGFYYAVRTTSSASRWATIEEIGKAHDISKISIKKYKEKDGIIYTESVKDERTFYISVFTVYDIGGKEVISEPKTAKVDRTISADLFWKVSKGLLGSLKLTISIVGNRPIEHVPELVLCGCNDGEFILTHDDPKAIEFIRINEVDLDKPQKNYTQSYDLAIVNYHKNMKFFLFETNPVRSEKFMLRWFQGFSGKV